MRQHLKVAGLRLCDTLFFAITIFSENAYSFVIGPAGPLHLLSSDNFQIVVNYEFVLVPSSLYFSARDIKHSGADETT